MQNILGIIYKGVEYKNTCAAERANGLPHCALRHAFVRAKENGQPPIYRGELLTFIDKMEVKPLAYSPPRTVKCPGEPLLKNPVTHMLGVFLH